MMNEKEDLKFCSRELNYSPRIVSYKKMWLFSRGENDTFLNCLSHDTVRLFDVDRDFSTDYSAITVGFIGRRSGLFEYNY